MPPIQRPDISRSLAKSFGIVGFGGPESLSPEIVPVVMVDDIRPSTSTRKCQGGLLQGAVAAENAQVQIFNPNNSRTILEVYQVIYTPSAISRIGMRESDAALPNGGATSRFTDRRLAGRPVGDVRSDTVAVLVGDGQGVWQSARDPGGYVIPVDYVLVPGTGIELLSETVNLSLFCTWFWRERAQLDED